jgi:DNA-binding transcriptional ArsR family regulator
MVEQENDPLDDVLKAAADPTRRAILTLVAQNGPTRVTEIAERFSQSLNAISRHIMVLERAGLVTRRTVWRAHYIEANPAPLAGVEGWIGGLRSAWALRLEALERILTQEVADGPDHDGRPDPDGDAQHRGPGGARL